MFFVKALSLVKLFLSKVYYGKRFKIDTYKQILRYGTRIFVGKKGLLSIGSVYTQPNVSISCCDGELIIGRGVSFNRNCVVVCMKKISIGDNCQFGPNVCIFDHDHSYDTNGVSKDTFKCADIIIGNGCWIGSGCIILRGTHIGENSVIEAGVVVKGNIPPNSLVMSSRGSRIIPMSFFKQQQVCT